LSLGVLLTGAALGVAAENQQTAFQLIKEGNRYVGEQAKDKVVQIRSERSVNGLEPNIWYVVYYDTTASLKATEVKFGAGRMLHVKRPFRLIETITGNEGSLDTKHFKVDSDKAIQIAIKEPLLEKLNIVATQLKLEQPKEATTPWWEVKLWATKLRRPDQSVNIGEVYVGAADGKILQTDLHIDRVD
jgi:hypothetical protein